MPFVAKLRVPVAKPLVLVAPNRAEPSPVACVEANERFRVGFACENAFPPNERWLDELNRELLRVPANRELENVAVSPRPALPPALPIDRLSKLESACEVETDDPVIRLELDERPRLDSAIPREPEFDAESPDPGLEPLRAPEFVPRFAADDAPFLAPPNEFQLSDLPAFDVPRPAASLDPRFAATLEEAEAPRLLLATFPELAALPLPAELPNECQLPSATAGRAFEGIRLDVLWKGTFDPARPLEEGPAARPPAEDRGA
jgi:hypothetical protein